MKSINFAEIKTQNSHFIFFETLLILKFIFWTLFFNITSQILRYGGTPRFIEFQRRVLKRMD